MNYLVNINGFADVYGQGAYGEGAYMCTQSTAGCSQAASTTTPQSTPLVNTGVAVVGTLTFACLLVCAVLFVRFWRQKRTYKLFGRV